MPRSAKTTETDMPPKVATVFASYPAGVRAKLLQLRRIILTTAS